MAKSPDRPGARQGRDPAKHSKKDPAKPTRAKASRPDSAPLDPALADLLNPAIGQGRAGVGSQTGLTENPSPLVGEGGVGGREAAPLSLTGAKSSSAPLRNLSTPTPNPSPTSLHSGARKRDPGGGGEERASKIAPAPDNSFDRRADFANAHRARASVARGFGEPPQQGYVGKTPVPPGELDPDLARALGIDEQEGEPENARNVITPDMGPAHLRLARSASREVGTVAGLASQQSLDQLLREGRAEFREQDGANKIWVPHRPPRSEKSEGGRPLVIKSDFDPKGDQPQAIADLVEGVRRNDRSQVLLGVTGSGKTFTMAKVIEETQRPALILAPNKTLAAQLYGEFRNFFPDNAVEYFVSYYDYYQPEAYIPRTDTYIEKDSSINEQIDRMRHSATRALLERDDVVIVASVSCIYGIGSVETYSAMTFSLKKGERIDQRALLADLVALQYKRSGGDFYRGSFRVHGDVIEIFPAHYEDRAWRVSLFGDEVELIDEFDPLTGQKTDELEFVKVYANSHYVTPRPTLLQDVVRKVRVEIIYDAIVGDGKPREANQAAIQKHQLDAVCHPRTNIKSISHNKFMVLCQNDQPLAIWTGSTNFTDGAVYRAGQCRSRY